jgi:hypothetical protein
MHLCYHLKLLNTKKTTTCDVGTGTKLWLG